MKKIITLLILWQISLATVWAQVEFPAADKVYTVIAEGRGSVGWAINDAVSRMVSFGATTITDDEQKNFAFVQHDDKVYLYSVWAEMFVQKDLSLSATLPIDDIKVENVEGGKFFFKYDNAHILNVGGSLQLFCDDWDTKDAGNQYTLNEVENFDPAMALAILEGRYTITYNFVYNGKEVASQTTKVLAGEQYPSIAEGLIPWGVTALVPSGAPSNNETITINCEIDTTVLPFEPTVSYDDEHMKWYYLQFHSDDKHYLYFKTFDEVLLTDKTACDEEDRDAYSWAFVGNPFDGYTIYNRKAYAQNPNLKLNANPEGAVLGTADHKFKAEPSAHGVRGFFLASEDGACNQRLNNLDGKVVYVDDAEDATVSSTFMVVERHEHLETLEPLIVEAETLLATISSNVGTKMGEYSPTTVETLATAIATAKALADAKTVGANDVVALQEAMYDVRENLPVVGQYYQIHSAYTAFPETKAVYSDGTEPGWKTLQNSDASFYWKAVDAGDGNVVFQNFADGKYLEGHESQVGVWTMTDSPDVTSNVGLTIFNKAEHEKGYEYGIVLGIWQMHCYEYGDGEGEGSYIVSWNTDSKNSPSSWYIVPVELHDITYNFVYNGEVKYTTTTSVFEGLPYPELEVPSFPYGVEVVGEVSTPEGFVTESKTFEYELTIELPFKTAVDVESIDTWYYARMHTNQPCYLGDIAEDNTINVYWGAESKEYNENFLWGFVGNVFDGIIVVNKGTGKQLTSTGFGDVTLTDDGTDFFIAPTVETSLNATDGFCLHRKGSNQYVHANYGAGKLSHWSTTDAASTMFLTAYKETEVFVSPAGYGTLYLDYTAYIPEGVRVYTVNSIEDGRCIMTPVEDVLPAYTGVVLSKEGVYTFKAAASMSVVQGNLLLGSVEDDYIEGDAYVLSYLDGEVGFNRVVLNKGANGEPGNTHFLNNANKAYLPAPPGASLVLRLNFGETTAVESVLNNSVDVNAPVYDLYGRRVKNVVNGGVYIRNGKKVIMR